jgi:hypothetical protein
LQTTQKLAERGKANFAVCRFTALSCWGSASVEVITLLLKAYLEAARFKDKDICKRDDKLPLLYACEKNAPVETITALLMEYPEAARERDISNSLPIHWACSNNAPIAVIAALLSAYPEAAKTEPRITNSALYRL